MINPCPAEFRQRTLGTLAKIRPDHSFDFAAASHLAGRLRMNLQTLRLWKKSPSEKAGMSAAGFTELTNPAAAPFSSMSDA